MARPTATLLTLPLFRAKDLTLLASALHVLGTRSRLETVQLLMGGPRLTVQLPARVDEMRMLEEIGVVTSELVGRQLMWTLKPEAVGRAANCLKD
ncbi:hypothetical protein [Flexivirga alba]|uniref:Transcriptional regulator n=1 Tax=Flexivirga alba TaxID=702742 RepID=A0ABW2AIW9_9MICO